MIPPPSRFFAVFSGKRHDITSWVGAGNNLKVLGLGMRRQQRSTTMGELDFGNLLDELDGLGV